jgi:hypothetical protein
MSHFIACKTLVVSYKGSSWNVLCSCTGHPQFSCHVGVTPSHQQPLITLSARYGRLITLLPTLIFFFPFPFFQSSLCAHKHKLHSKQRSGNLPVLAIHNNAAKPSTLQATHLLYPITFTAPPPAYPTTFTAPLPYCCFALDPNDSVSSLHGTWDFTPVARIQSVIFYVMTPCSLAGSFQVYNFHPENGGPRFIWTLSNHLQNDGLCLQSKVTSTWTWDQQIPPETSVTMNETAVSIFRI